jgi:iron complex transport system substrate-binding protein
MRRTFLAVATIALVGAVAACGTDPGTPAPGATGSPDQPYPVTVGSLTLNQRPERIVSLAPTATEMLFAIDASAQVVAVDENSNHPPQAPKTKLSGYTPNVETIATYRPDLVIISDDIGKISEQLGRLKIPTFVTPAATSLEDTYAQIADLGTLTGHSAQARAVVDRMRADIDQLVAGAPARTPPLTYYYELDPTFYSVTSKTFIGSLFASVGLVNIADASSGGNAYPQLSAEVIVDADPDLIFLADSNCCGQSAATVAARAGWGGITALRTGGVVALDDDIASRWGPRVVDLLRAITAAVAKAPVS